MADSPNVTSTTAVEAPKPSRGPGVWGTGRRKSAIARVRLTPGNGQIAINTRPLDKYFTEEDERAAVKQPFLATNTLGRYDMFVNVAGGGHNGQAGAIRMGVARALAKIDPAFTSVLRDQGLLTRDSRIVERKKYGRRKARRRFQFSKR